MDFDNSKVYGDTSITDGLVLPEKCLDSKIFGKQLRMEGVLIIFLEQVLLLVFKYKTTSVILA